MKKWARTAVRIACLIGASPSIVAQVATLPATSQLASERLIESALLKEDLAFLVRTCEQVHPNLYHTATCKQVETLSRQLGDSIPGPMSGQEFWPIAARLAAVFGEGHTFVQPFYEEFSAYVKAGGLVFPLRVEIQDDRVDVIKSAEDGPLAPGDTLLAINGVPMPELTQRMLACIPSEPPGNRLRLQRWFALWLWAHNLRPPYDVSYRTADGTVRQTTLAGVTAETLRKETNTVTKPGAYVFTWLEKDIALIDFRQMNDPTNFRAFLRRNFHRFEQQAPAGLIIDLRQNGGGSSMVGEALLPFITDRPYRMAGGVNRKASPQAKERNKSDWNIPGFEALADGVLFMGPLGEPRPPADEPLRFHGPVCVLIGPGTYSSAMMLADAIKTYRLATLIGEPIAECTNDYGDVYLFTLPHSGLKAGVSTSQFIRASGDEKDMSLIQPDIEVRQSPQDTAHGVDTVLERAKQWIREQSGTAGGPSAASIKED